MYPNQKPAVANPAALPLVGNTLGDMRVVNDDGDGNSSSYQWQQREGDATPKWYKIYDVDFSTDSILAAWNNVTQDMYVVKYGRDDTDDTGAVVVGTLAGQKIWGGKSANTNLTLYANSGDGTGANTGYVQFGDNVRPIADDTFSLGTNANKFSNLFSHNATLADFIITDDTISSSTGIFDIIDNDLITTGMVAAEYVDADTSPSSFAAGTVIGNITISTGSIISAGGTVSFGTNHLFTSGNAQFADINITDNIISSDSNVIDFDTNDLINIDSIDAITGLFNESIIGGLTHNLTISTAGNLNHSTALAITAPTSVTVTTPIFDIAGNQTNSGTIVAQGKITGSQLEFLNGGRSILIGGATNTILSNGAVLIINSSSGTELTSPNLYPTGATTDLGTVTNLFRDMFLSGSIHLANTNTIGQAALSSLRNAYTRKLAVAPSDGDTLFWDAATQSWYADHPDSEIDHGELTGLNDDDHSMYLARIGRTGGQVAHGGTGAGDNLVLSSTQNATKGFVYWRDVLAPETDGTDLGTITRQIGDSYFKGQAKGFRVESFTTVTFPSASAAKTGRVAFDTDLKALYVDDGGVWRRAGAEKSVTVDAAFWDGTQLTKTYTVSADVQDATKGMWEFYLTSTGERLYPTITKTTTQVTVTFKVAIPSASYTLIGVA